MQFISFTLSHNTGSCGRPLDVGWANKFSVKGHHSISQIKDTKSSLHNPNTFVGLVGKVRKKLSPEGGRKGGWRKKARAARPPGPGLEPGTCRVLGEGPQLHATGVV